MKRFFTKKTKSTNEELSRGEKDYFYLRNLEVEESGFVSPRFIITIDQLFRAWKKGYTKYEVTYQPRTGGGVGIIKFNDRLHQLDKLGVKYIVTPIGADPTLGCTLSIRR